MIEKPNKAKFDVGGVLYDKVRLTMVLDGYTAPVTAGTIVDLIQRGERKCILVYFVGASITVFSAGFP